MTDVLEELTGDPLTKLHVEERIEDWVRRIDDLYARIAAWLPAGFVTSVAPQRVRMLERPMIDAGVDERPLPMLDLFKDGEPVAAVRPASLWVIGANGRLDLIVGRDHYLIIDAADNFDASRWFVMPAWDQMHRLPFDRNFLLSVI